MNGQAQGLAALVEEPLGKLHAPFALVTGGKGGVGKSSLALNLAIALGERGRRVLLVDLDLGLGDLAVMLKLSPPRTLEDFFLGGRPLRDCRAPLGGGVDLLAGGAGSSELARPDGARRTQLFAGLAELAPDYDLILADSAAGIGPSVLAFAARADCVLCVATPIPPRSPTPTASSRPWTSTRRVPVKRSRLRPSCSTASPALPRPRTSPRA